MELKKVTHLITAPDMRHAVVTERSAALRAVFPWGFSIQKILHAVRPTPFHGGHLFVGSDYGGDHKRSSYNTYAFVVVNDPPTKWLLLQKEIRSKQLKDSRRMSFKRLGDSQRQEALIPFLQAADTLDGHLVVFVVDKTVRLHPTSKEDVESWQRNFDLSARWNRRSFEHAIRKAHFFSLIVAQWSKPLMDVTWVSDQDEFVASDKHLDDAQKLAAQFSSLYLPHTLREFAMNTTEIDEPSLEFEDLVAIPDLAAGMLSDLSSTLAKGVSWADIDGRHVLESSALQTKSEILADWFWHSGANLRRACIVIDKVGTQSRVFKLDMSP